MKKDFKGNHRLVTILSVLSKLYEMSLFKQIPSFLKKSFLKVVRLQKKLQHATMFFGNARESEELWRWRCSILCFTYRLI